jgi:hypothetical protein
MHFFIGGRLAFARVGHHGRMDEKREQVEEEELESQDGEELPDREVMSVIVPDPVDGDVVFPVEGDPGDRW